MRKPKMRETARGFAQIDFKDHYGTECSLQESSLATEHAIWLGCNETNPQVCIPGRGWTPVPLPHDTLCNTRMHLTRKEVEMLLPYLQKFVETGELR